MNHLKKFVLFLTLTAVGTLAAAIKLPAFFSDHAVLARHKEVPVFGTADPGETVTVTLGDQKVKVAADEKGYFKAVLDLSDAPVTPQNLKVNDLVIKDVLVGGVFLASGQSNMNLRLRSCDSLDQEKKRPGVPQIRFFIVNTAPASRPTKAIRGKWVKLSPGVISTFSGVAYHFARKIYEETAQPVGIIQSSVGGTPVESWMSQDAIHRFPNVARVGREREEAYNQYPEKFKKFVAAQTAWEKKHLRSDTAAKAVYPRNAQWKPLKNYAIDGNGVVWLRNNFTISDREAEKGFVMFFRYTHAPFSIWVDGRKIGDTGSNGWLNKEYRHFVKGGKLQPGRHEVALRYHIARNNTRFRTPIIFGKCDISKNWQIFREQEFSKLSRQIMATAPKSPGVRIRAASRWAVLYNGMIHPFVPTRLTGVIWYQGESNTSRAWEYGKIFPAMITDWREKFADPELPFYFVMLAPYLNKTADANSTEEYALLRNAQLKALKLPHTAMAVISDAGEAKDIHPLDKKTPGERLAAAALKNIYGKDIPCSSPMATHAKLNKGAVTVFFDHTYGSLNARELPATHHLCKAKKQTAPLIRMSPDAQLEGFTLKDKDGKWHWADQAEITGANQVTVSASACPDPVMIRYNFQNNPTCNLFNQAGFPAAPFELILQ